MGPIWGRQDPGRPHVGPVNFAIWVVIDQTDQINETDIQIIPEYNYANTMKRDVNYYDGCFVLLSLYFSVYYTHGRYWAFFIGMFKFLSDNYLATTMNTSILHQSQQKSTPASTLFKYKTTFPYIRIPMMKIRQ